jgi:hypothetical protein
VKDKGAMAAKPPCHTPFPPSLTLEVMNSSLRAGAFMPFSTPNCVRSTNWGARLKDKWPEIGGVHAGWCGFRPDYEPFLAREVIVLSLQIDGTAWYNTEKRPSAREKTRSSNDSDSKFFLFKNNA